MTAPLRCVVCALAWGGALGLRADDLPAAAQAVADDYAERIEQAAAILNETRARILEEKAPLFERMRRAEDRILRAESELARLEADRATSSDERRRVVVELDGIRRNSSYVASLARDGLKATRDGLSPGEDQVWGEALGALEQGLERGPDPLRAAAALAVAEFLVERTATSLGGYRAPGRAMISETRQVLPGTFAFVGPEAFFQPESGAAAGAVRPREGAAVPVSHGLPGWDPAVAGPFFAGGRGVILVDASQGKALKLQETTGSLWDHVRKGGMVSFAILGVGVLAAVMIVQKVRDLVTMGVDSSAAVNPVLDRLAAGAPAEAGAAVVALQRGTRELFEEALRYRDHAKSVLEEKLAVVLLSQRLRHERRLPLLAVIATAAPLMGLLGTVVGMVKTFALITVFGTGNAAKLSSGISEVLVATELGLAVAIPTLVAHGFLAHRIQRKLSLQERYALQCVTAIDMGRAAAADRTVKEAVLA